MSETYPPAAPSTPADADGQLDQLYRQVVRGHQRVEVSLPDGQCVIISKDELEALEKALEILADSDALRSVSASIEHLCDACRE